MDQVFCDGCGEEINEDDIAECDDCGTMGCIHCLPDNVCENCEVVEDK